MLEKIKELLFGKPKSPLDPKVFHKVSLIAFFAWVGLGADGLSSSCYGPEEAFLSLGHFTHLALPLALMTAVTVFILSASYSQIIELFPAGGGGYLVASRLIGPKTGLVSGCALLVDYVLTVAVSIASSMDAIFSFLPHDLLRWKFLATLLCLLLLIILNLRGVKESVLILTPIFIVFLITHLLMIFYGIFSHGAELPALMGDTVQETRLGVAELGSFAMLFILLRAFSLGGGTYTGIEAVSNGLAILREPRVKTGKKTMMYMAISLAFTAGGLLVAYILNNVHHIPGRTLNATLFYTLTAPWPLGNIIVFITLLSEGALLLVAAQTGFLGGPRVMSNMAVDNWLPRRFTNLSDRLVIKDGVLAIGLAALLVLLYTNASVKILVVMYSINVFLTFALSQWGMVRHWVKTRPPQRFRKLPIPLLALLLTVGILLITSVLKFKEGGWVTIAVTGTLVLFCLWVKQHYSDTYKTLRHLDEILTQLPLPEAAESPEKLPQKPSAILMVNGYNGMGIHSFLAIHRFFPGHFKNFVFLSVGVIDSDRFKDTEEIEKFKAAVQIDLDKYVRLANRMGLYAESHMAFETDVIEGLEQLCQQVSSDWHKKVYFTGQLAFEGETFLTRFLHNQTAFALQRKLLFSGLEVVILPIRVRLPQRLPG
ncbi:MAG TPA: APC family permease [Elusimicrobiota bacterium]|nr:APC family permease [Elusimicrobiota bacterium]